jgi:DNA-directed RNA polymerase subunit RPC12/RpoP
MFMRQLHLLDKPIPGFSSLPYDEKDAVLHCPKCGYPQFCGCVTCMKRIPKDVKPYRWEHGEVIVCGNCGFAAHCDWWLTLEGDVFFKELMKG